MTRLFSRSILGITAFVLSGCGPQSGTGANVVRIGYQKTGSLNLLRLRGSLEADLSGRDVKIEWVGFPAGPQMLEALNAGVVDFGHAGDAPPVLAQAAGVPFVYVAYEPARPHAEAILVPKGSTIASTAELAGKRVALNKGSNVQILLVRALKSGNVTLSDVKPVYLAPADARSAFEGGAVDAWAIWDPYFAEAELHAAGRILADGEGIVANREFQFASRRLADERPEVVKTIIRALDREGRWAEAHRDEVAVLLADELGLELAVMRRVLERKSYGVRPMSDPVVEEQQKIADEFLALGLIPSPLRVRDVLYSGTLDEIAGPAAAASPEKGNTPR